jgi:O-antigen/teichoic acid export membrane protein
MRRDLLSAYAASGARVLSWVGVSALLFRADPLQYAMLALIRGTVGLLNYTSLGLAPAMVRALAQARHAGDADLATNVASTVTATKVETVPVLHYSRPDDAALRVYASGKLAAALTGAIGIVLAAVYAFYFPVLHKIPPGWEQLVGWTVVLMGAGTVFRLMSDAAGAVIQTNGSIARDNALVVVSEAVWVVLAILVRRPPLGSIALGFAASGLLLFVLRWTFAGLLTAGGGSVFRYADSAVVKRLLAFGSLVALAQLADFLYAPTDYVLINRFVAPAAVAIYSPAVQIDAGLLLVVGAIAAVLLPKAAVAHAAGETHRLTRYYVRGTLAGAGMLLAASVVVYFLSPWIFKAWLGNTMSETRAILPLVLAHTVLGGSSGVGRSILLAMGKAKPFAVAMLVAGVANVICSYVFVAHMGLGLRGVIYGTIAVAVGRCVIWQPWYVLRTLRREAKLGVRAMRPDAVAVAPEPI